MREAQNSHHSTQRRHMHPLTNKEKRQVRWDVVDVLFNHIESQGELKRVEEEEYFNEQIERVAKMLGITNHVYLKAQINARLIQRPEHPVQVVEVDPHMELMAEMIQKDYTMNVPTRTTTLA